jgi:hypothetical protein
VVAFCLLLSEGGGNTSIVTARATTMPKPTSRNLAMQPGQVDEWFGSLAW